MNGIECGATGITLGSGEHIDFPRRRTPDDILRRVAASAPFVQLSDEGCEVLDPAELYASLLADVLHGLPQDDAPFVLAVPSWWPQQATASVQRALEQRAVSAILVGDAEAAVAGYQGEREQLIGTVAVVSVRAHQSSVVAVRLGGGQPVALPSPTLVRGEGGRHLDAAVLRHLLTGLTDMGDRIDANDPKVIRAAQESLEQCRELREALSASATESVLPQLPGAGHRLLFVRSELDELATPWMDTVVDMVRTALDQCSDEIDSVLLAGGLAAMPLVSQRISADLSLDVRVPESLDTVVASGAGLIAREFRGSGRSKLGWASLKARVGRGRVTEASAAPAEPELSKALVWR